MCRKRISKSFAVAYTEALNTIKIHLPTDEFKTYLNRFDFSYLDVSDGTEGDYVFEKLNTFPFSYLKFYKFYVSFWNPWTWKNRNTAAYTNKRWYREPNQYKIWMNSTTPYSYYDLFIIHEVCHLDGFSHGDNYNAGNKGVAYHDSVPVIVQNYFGVELKKGV